MTASDALFEQSKQYLASSLALYSKDPVEGFLTWISDKPDEVKTFMLNFNDCLRELDNMDNFFETHGTK